MHNVINKTQAVRIAIMGAGLIGERHARLAEVHPDVELAAIIDPDPKKSTLAAELNCGHFNSLTDIAPNICDAVVIATPNSDHLKSGLQCLEMGLPCLIEKPIADTVENAEKLAVAFENQNIPLLIGHHRRYHHFSTRAKDIIEKNKLGRPILASIIWAVRKPDSYFKQGVWRTKSDGGPLLINFIHEADLLLYIFGKVINVQATTSNRQRKQSVEDTAAIILTFETGVIATVVLSDTALTPWSFEGACGENPNIAETGISSWRIGCTEGAFDFPNLNIWTDSENGIGDWSRKLKSQTQQVSQVDPLYDQLSHFVELIRGTAKKPICSGRDGLEALRLVEWIKRSADTSHFSNADVTSPLDIKKRLA
ncbi:Gfo/Idh/MocA family protein [Lentilitoribacter sp. EG35]|uniref:Gfo/Idh/MocA family protein n=1 Tax=Lentilitoribacter sp. EG35 TaxID=3234192 RepID=UPI0034613509